MRKRKLCIKVRGKLQYLGTFDGEAEAARAFDAAAREHRGPNPAVNFPVPGSGERQAVKGKLHGAGAGAGAGDRAGAASTKWRGHPKQQQQQLPQQGGGVPLESRRQGGHVPAPHAAANHKHATRGSKKAGVKRERPAAPAAAVQLQAAKRQRRQA